MKSNVALTALTVALSVASLVGCIILALIFYVLRRKKQASRLKSTPKPMLKTTPLPMKGGILQMRQSDYRERFYSDSEDSGAIINRWRGSQLDERSGDDLSDFEYVERRSSSLLSRSSSGEHILLSSYEDGNTSNEISRTPGSSAESSPTMHLRICFINLSMKYNFHQESLAIVVINVSSPPKQKSSSKGLFVVLQLLRTRENGEMEDVDVIQKTEIRPYSSNVLFNDEFRYSGLSSSDLDDIIVKFSLCSHDRFSRVQAFGEFIVNLNEVAFDPIQPLTIQRSLEQANNTATLDDKDKGELSLSLRYQRGSRRISVIVLKASNLKKPRKFMTNDPYITVKLLYNGAVLVKKKTRSKKGSSSPCWNVPFAFDLEEEDLDKYMLLFTIKGKDIFSTCTKLGVVRIGAGAESSGKEHWNESVRSKNNTMRQVTMTHKLS